jgi:hypothetical protein
MSASALGYVLNRAGYHGHHVPHGFRATFSRIMNERLSRTARKRRAIIDPMLAHVTKGKVEGAHNLLSALGAAPVEPRITRE